MSKSLYWNSENAQMKTGINFTLLRRRINKGWMKWKLKVIWTVLQGLIQTEIKSTLIFMVQMRHHLIEDSSFCFYLVKQNNLLEVKMKMKIVWLIWNRSRLKIENCKIPKTILEILILWLYTIMNHLLLKIMVNLP